MAKDFIIANPIQKIDSLFTYLFNKRPDIYTTYADIVNENRLEGPFDIEGMLLKMHKDGYLDSGAVNNQDIIEGFRQQGIYKLSYVGRMFFVKPGRVFRNKPYAYKRHMERVSFVWKAVKIFAAVLNALAIIWIAWNSLKIDSVSKNENQEVKTLKKQNDSLIRMVQQKKPK